MPHDPVRVAETAAWLRKATEDLRLGDLALRAEPPILGGAAFHAQQAVEKAFKGFLVWHERPFRKTHNLVELGEACAAIDPPLEPLLRRAAPLTEYAWRFRYPGTPGDPTEEEAYETLGLAREVYEAILALLPEEVRP